MRNIVLVMLIGLFPVAASAQNPQTATNAQTAKSTKITKGAEAKELAGMSVLGNNDTPKALYIVPWKTSELGAEADLRTGLLNDAMAPVDKEVFLRHLQFYEVSNNRP